MRWDDLGVFWEDMPTTRARGAARVLGPMPSIPDTGWLPVSELPNIRDKPWISLDCETWDPELQDYGPGWARGKGHIVGVSIAVEGNGPDGIDKWYFPIRHTVQPELNMDPERVLSWLRFSLAGNQPKIGANLLYDVGWLAHEGVAINGPLYDCQYAEGLLDEEGRLALEEIGWKYLKRGKTSDLLEDWIMSYYMPPKKFWRREIYRSPVTLTGPYAEDDAAMPYQILVKQWPQLVQRGLMDLFVMECKLIPLLIAMRFAGIQVDLPYAEKCKSDFNTRADEIHGRLEHVAGCKVNINSAETIARAFDKHNIPYKKTATGKPSFKAEFLNTVKHPVAALIVEERKLRKLVATFIQGYILDAHVNEFVYASFHPMVGEFGGARSGRFSSSDPNLQNIPIRTEEGKLMRAMFRHNFGHKQYRSGDYSQVEYRLLAHFATGEGADEVRAEYNNNAKLDYHDMISRMINQMTGYAVQLKNGTVLPGSSLAGLLHLVREHIKTLNFALVYGVGGPHLAEMLGVLLAKGKEISAAFHKAVPFARTTMDTIAAEIGQTGICTTILGRQSHFDLWEPDDWNNGSYRPPLPYEDAVDAYGPNIRRAYLYAGLNYKLQGSAADVMKKGMLDCWEQGIFSYTGVPRLTVHDELGFSDDGSAPEDAWREMVHIMETTIPLRVPLRFDLKAGQSWMECK